MPRTASPKLTKSEASRLTGRQSAALKRTAASVDSAKTMVGALRAKKSAQQEAVQARRGHLAKLDSKLEAHPLTIKRGEKADEILVAKSELQDIVDQLARAQAQLEAKITKRNDTIVSLRSELTAGDDDADDDDEDDDDDEM